MQISRFFISGDIKGAIEYMRDREEFKDILPAYVAIFEDRKYRTYEVPDALNNILRLYQIYFRDTFYFIAVLRNRTRQASCWQSCERS